jgi:hypothetical protein
MATHAPNQLHSVPLAEVQPDPTQPRKCLDPQSLEELNHEGPDLPEEHAGGCPLRGEQSEQESGMNSQNQRSEAKLK